MRPRRPCRKRGVEVQIEAPVEREAVPEHPDDPDAVIPLEVDLAEIVFVEEVVADDEPLVIPEAAVVVAGSRQISRGKGAEWGISLYTPVIVKYRDERTDAKIQLEDLLR